MTSNEQRRQLEKPAKGTNGVQLSPAEFGERYRKEQAEKKKGSANFTRIDRYLALGAFLAGIAAFARFFEYPLYRSTGDFSFVGPRD